MLKVWDGEDDKGSLPGTRCLRVCCCADLPRREVTAVAAAAGLRVVHHVVVVLVPSRLHLRKRPNGGEQGQEAFRKRAEGEGEEQAGLGDLRANKRMGGGNN